MFSGLILLSKINLEWGLLFRSPNRSIRLSFGQVMISAINTHKRASGFVVHTHSEYRRLYARHEYMRSTLAQQCSVRTCMALIINA